MKWSLLALMLHVGGSSNEASTTSSSSSRGGRHLSPYPSCQAIIDACHPYDVGEGPIHDCHDLASNGPEAACAPKKDECVATCKPDAG
jgi:hypothetical protein